MIQMQEELPEEKRLDAVQKELCAWYRTHKRALPWRKGKDPYRIWISEIMLQQTRVEAVKPYYERFLQALPDLPSLAEVSNEELMKLWEGLGYYSRAANLKKTAEICVEKFSGKLPETYEELLALPGIGSYTAGAVASIAYGLSKPAVDGNVVRVIFRILGCRDTVSQKKKEELEKKLEALLLRSNADPGEFNQALMELGACVCIPNGEPLCSVCPVQALCIAKRDGLADQLPVKPEKKKRREEEKTVMIVSDGVQILLEKRPESGLLAGLYEPVLKDGYLCESEIYACWRELTGEKVKIEELESGKHVFSHVEWNMKAWKIVLPGRLEAYRKKLEQAGFCLCTKEEIKEAYAIPGAFSRWKRFWIS